ncbi:auxilin-like protein 1 [Rhododendron vialii]|uniref:auxilin-like protein 1 n=1 Tax=Rhododendron vialii TaxID=182163 RepID=UPI00265F0314|nr:auxilin-like protein 1 [Rhododendron vialii]
MARLSKKAYNNGNGFGDHEAVYDDVFRGPPKFGLPTLSPRVEDYAEIFGGFHASRASSIPILDLPALDHEANFSFEESSHFDYSQVFSASNACDFAVTFEQLFNQSNKNSCDEAWTPAQSESLSDESDPSAGSERSRSLSNGESHQSCDGIKHFNILYNKASQGSKEDISTGMALRTQLLAVPGFTCVFNGNPLSQKKGDRDTPFLVTDVLNPSVDFSGRTREGKQFRKTVSHQATSSFGTMTCRTDLKPVGHGRSASCMDGAFVTVTDISLRTQPSQLPPPLRPPPVIAVKDGDLDTQNVKFKASKSFSLGETAGDSSPPFLDVEVDASSSAAVSAAAMKDAMENAEAKLKSVKELAERKKEGLQSRTKQGLHNDAKYRKEKPSREIDVSNCFNEDRTLGTFQRDCSGMKTFSGDERKELMTMTLVDSDSTKEEGHKNLATISADKKHGKDNLSQVCNESEASVAWGQAHNYQLVETDKCRNNFDPAEDYRVSMQNAPFHEPRQEKKETAALQEQEDDNTQIRADREALELDNGKEERSKATKESSRQEKQGTNVNMHEEGCEQEEKGKQSVAQPKIPVEADKSEVCENLAQVKHNEHGVKVERKLKEATEKIEDDETQKDCCEREENERRLKETLERERYEKGLKEATTERAEIEKRLKEALDQEEREKQQGEACESKNKEKRQKEAHEREENEKRSNESLEQEENKKRFKEALEREDTAKKLKLALKEEENEKQLKLAHERDENEERLLDDHKRQEIEKKLKVAYQQGGDGEKQKEAQEREEKSKERLPVAYKREENEKRLTEAWGQDENERRLQEVCGREESEKRLKEDLEHEEIDKRPEGANDCEETQKGIEVAGYLEEFKGCSNDHEQHVKDENGRRLISNQGTFVNAKLETLKASNVAVEVVNVLTEEQSNSSGLAEDDPQHEKSQTRKKYSMESLHLHDSVKSVEAGIDSKQIQIDSDEKTSGIASNNGKPHVLSNQLGERGPNVEEVEVTFEMEETEDKFMSSQVATELVENGRKMRADQTAVLEEKINAQRIPQKASTSQYIKRKGKSLNNILAPEKREKQDSMKRELEKDCQRKIEEEREREREREKDRMAVDRAGPEARESAFVEARERAERAILERATSEVRQRVMAEARERLEKAHAEARERSLAEKASVEARLRAERAAVERVTAEARERAFQKAMNEKATFEARERIGRSVADKASASCNNGGIRQNTSFSDLQDMQCQGVGFSRNSYSSSSVHCGFEGESAQRCKARLERHQRTAERAAKALAEKNMRDLLALKEQAEKNRLAEALDVEVKRWSSGKEGNLRALLSTLQYILGPDSGWQPIPLTEVITSAAVKKAYRKATLCVHPDKLQQRGASIQKKYICEKVFDLLKEAWHKFNSEER